MLWKTWKSLCEVNDSAVISESKNTVDKHLNNNSFEELGSAAWEFM